MTASARYTRAGLAISEKRTHFGRAGEFFAMSELLLRGWNVAVPVVDVGDDVFVIDDREKTTYRVQVKSSRVVETSGTERSVNFKLSRAQLREPKPIELFYMLMVREAHHWRFFVVPRDQLFRLHEKFLAMPRSGPGRKPVSHEDAKTDGLVLTLNLDPKPTAWGASLAIFEGCWPEELRELPDGPGSVRSTD